MFSLRSVLVVLLAPCAAVGCSEVFNSSDLDKVSVRAEMIANEADVTINNRSNDMLSYGGWFCSPDGALEGLEEDGEWRNADDMISVNCVSRNPISIDPGDKYVEAVRIHAITDLGPGTYRFRLVLRDGNDDLLPDEARISNTFRIQ